MWAADDVTAFRAEYRAREIGPLYSGWCHFAFTSAGSLAVIAFAATRLSAVAWWEWLVIPAAFLLANAAEYFGHRGPMHRRRRGLRVLYERHALQHHRFFTAAAMTYASSRDFKMVLFPPVMLFFFLGCLAAPIGVAFHLLVSPNAGWLFVVVGMAYFLTYEWLHFTYHLPETSWAGRLPLVGLLRRHHVRHHDPALMGRRNFNITFPICDWLFGTLHRGGH